MRMAAVALWGLLALSATAPAHGGLGIPLRRTLAPPALLPHKSPPNPARGAGSAPLMRLRGGAEEGLDQLVLALTSSDNQQRQEAEQRYNVVKKENPDSTCTTLLNILGSGEATVEARSMAAVLARTEFTGLWESVSPQTQEHIKATLLQILQAETQDMIVRKVGNIVAVLSYLARDGKWPDLLPTLIGMASADSNQQRERSLTVLSLVPVYMHSKLLTEISRLKPVYESALAHPDLTVQVAGLKAVGTYLEGCSRAKDMRELQHVLPQMLNVIGNALSINEEHARSGLTMLIDITEDHSKFFKPNINEVVQAMVGIATNEQLEAGTRQLGLDLLVELSEKAPGMMKKCQGFVDQAVAVSLSLMVNDLNFNMDQQKWGNTADPREAEGESDDEGDHEKSGNLEVGQESLDRLSIALGGSVVMPAAFRYIPDFLNNAQDWRYRMVGLMTISQIGEGSFREMKKHLAQVVEMVLPRVLDTHPRVRWAALNCIGQMCTDFGPNLQKDYCDQLLPALTHAMDATKEPAIRVRVHASAAVINFCEHAEPEMIKPYLDGLMKQLNDLLHCGQRKGTEQSITTVASMALAVGEGFAAYYPLVMPFLMSIIGNTAVAKEDRLTRGKAMECISLVGMAVGKDVFREDANVAMKLLLQTQHAEAETDDQTVNYIHSACGRICRCLGDEFVQYLPGVLPSLLKSAAIKPDMKVADEDDYDNENFEEMSTVQVGDQVVGIKTSELEEKATACHMISTYAAELKGGFFPYVEQVGQVMKPLLQFWYHEDVRSSAIQVMPSLVISAKEYSRANNMDGSVVKQVLDYVFKDLLDAMQKEHMQDLQGQAARALGQCVSECGQDCLSSEDLVNVAKALQQLLNDSRERTEEASGRGGTDEGDEEEERSVGDYEQLELEEDLTEQISYCLARLLETHMDAFLPVLEQVLPWFMERLADPSSAQQRLGINMLDDVLEIGKDKAARFVPSFAPHMLKLSHSTDMELRQASIYGVGLCAQHGGAQFSPFIDEALAKLTHIVSEPDARGEDKESPTDNAVSSLGKIAQHHQIAQAPQVWSMWLNYLPLKADVPEGVLVHKQLCALVEQNHPEVLGANNCNLPRIISIFSLILETSLCDTECAALIRNILIQAEAGLGDVVQKACMGLPPAQMERLQRVVQGGVPPPQA